MVKINLKFFALPEEKQRSIINAAMKVFSRKGYDNSSTEEISKNAGVSKSLIFHYFKNKETLYRFVAEYAFDTMVKHLEAIKVDKNEDFFDLMKKWALHKERLYFQHPDMSEMLLSVYYEKDEEIIRAMQEKYLPHVVTMAQDVISSINRKKLRKGLTPEEAYKLLYWCFEGMMKEIKLREYVNVDEIMKKSFEILDSFKIMIYEEGKNGDS